MLRALNHRDPTTQFLAAEGLGRGGREEGLGPLLAAVDLQEDWSLRERAVQALGELGDRRAYDLLLKIANDPEHGLRAAAVEALGRVGRAGKGHEILQLLQDLARGQDPVAQGALSGLRWFDHPEGWQLIRRRAADSSSWLQEHAVELLGYNDDPATRDLLLRLLATTDEYDGVFNAALESSRRLWGRDSLEPDYAAVQNPNLEEEQRKTLLDRLREHGDARRMLEILPKLNAEMAEELKGILLSRQPLPVAEAESVTSGPDATAAGVAAHLLGRARAASSGPVVTAGLRRWWQEWDEKRREEIRRGVQPGSLAGTFAEPLRSLTWAAGRLGVASDMLLAIARTRADQSFDRTLRREAVAALAMTPIANAPGSPLEELIAGDDPEIRVLAAEASVLANPARAGEVARQVLGDRAALDRVARHDGGDLVATLRGAVSQVHYQGTVVPQLLARRDVTSLAAVATNSALPEDTRLGAVEGLAAMGSEAAEAELVRVGKALENSEELRKAAWRGLRRSKRARQNAASIKVVP